MKRNGLVAVAGIALAAAMTPVTARANVPEIACSTGSLKVCSAVRYSVVQSGTQWQVKVWVWNLFGASGQPASLQNVLTYVGLASNVWTGNFSVLSATYGGNAVSWSKATNFPSNLGLKLDLGAKDQGGINNGLIGCNVTPKSGQIPTCYNDTNKALEIVFNTSSKFVLDNTSQGYWEVHSQLTNCSLWMNSNGAATDSIPAGGCGQSTTVTPEPVTMALLGTGLAGMGLARLRRRKKDGDIESV